MNEQIGKKRVRDDDVGGDVGKDESLFLFRKSPDIQEERKEARELWQNTVRARSADLARTERVRSVLEDQFHAVSQVTKYLIPVTIFVLMWHHLLPRWLGWLTTEQQDGIRWILVGGIGLGSISGFAYKYISGRRSDSGAIDRLGL